MGATTELLRLDDPQCLYADARMTLKTVSMDGQPVILAEGRVHWAATNFLRNLRETGRSIATVDNYRSILQDFLTIVHDAGRTWDMVDDEFLGTWRRHLMEDRGIANGTFNDRIDLIVRFYRWSQENYWIQNIIGEGSANGRKYPISLADHPRKRNAKISDWRFLTERKSITEIPSQQVLEDIDCEIAVGRKDRDLVERDQIVIAWLRGPGLRRSEVLRLKCRQIPTIDQIDALEDSLDDDPIGALLYRIVIRRSKRGGERAIYVPLTLLRRTREWIDGYRRKMLTAKMKRGVILARPQEIFVSTKSGKVLQGQAISNMYMRARTNAARLVASEGRTVRSAVPHRKARIHHLRHVAITDQYLMRRMAGQDQGTALWKTKEVAGHRSVRSTEIYMHIGERLLPEAKQAEETAAKHQNNLAESQRRIDAIRAAGGQEAVSAVDEVQQAISDGTISAVELKEFLKVRRGSKRGNRGGEIKNSVSVSEVVA
ncbi:hypothetical protein AA309_23260 [Microvirga vignae]|uniref:Integrase n=1 Tax=Microvirga vignae TaxID=1225564 RepID=A0A0H1R743_9HYPH|nr:site-specific integrase [Microvirga vignae]KLK90844.1 hypothetical protein AA309_23260 [Microvirga vignae]